MFWEEWAERIDILQGELWWVQNFLAQGEADQLFERLLADACWKQPVIKMFGREINSPRLAAWYGDPEAIYTYSGLRNEPLPWLDPLQILRQRLQTVSGVPFNSVLLNLYRNGGDSMGWHSDDEKELGNNPIIASLSLGASRRFRLRPRCGKAQGNIDLLLGHGALLIMAGETQHNWRHCVPKSSRDSGARINLTYRYICPTVIAVERGRSRRGLD